MQLGSLGPPPPHMDPNLVTPSHSHLSPEPTPLPPSGLTPQTSPSTVPGQNSFTPSSSSISPSLGGSIHHQHSFQRPTSPGGETLLPGTTKSIEGSLAASTTDLENKSAINALECLRPWTSPNSPHFTSLSGRVTASTLASSGNIVTDTSVNNKG